MYYLLMQFNFTITAKLRISCSTFLQFRSQSYTSYDFIANFIAIQILFDTKMTFTPSKFYKENKKANKRVVF